jgi:hypothetical protein
MTPDLAAIRERHTAATKGPWKVWNGIDIYPESDDFRARHHIADCNPDGYDETFTDIGYEEANANARFIGHSWQDIDTILRHVEIQAARIAELESRLAEQEPLEDGVVAV